MSSQTSDTPKPNNRLAILPKLQGLGGPSSFQSKLIKGLSKRGIQSDFNPLSGDANTLLVVGGTKQLHTIWRARKKGIRVVQRLNGMNWIHTKKNTGIKHYLRSEYGNMILSTIRKHLADALVYQSQFARSWWQTAYGRSNVEATVIYNGVDLDEYTPSGPHDRPGDHIRVLLVEGHLGEGNESGLMNAVQLVEQLNQRLSQPVELMVAGKVPQKIIEKFSKLTKVWINWVGIIQRNEIPKLDRSAHLLFSADLNAACPNSVIEALACGLPVVAYSTGSLPEILQNDAGRTAPYGSNYWELEKPDVSLLVEDAMEILNNLEYFQQQARKQAENLFSLDFMVDEYLKILFPT
jgi:glycosyltransferase involved in cell wall biosynthesis